MASLKSPAITASHGRVTQSVLRDGEPECRGRSAPGTSGPRPSFGSFHGSMVVTWGSGRGRRRRRRRPGSRCTRPRWWGSAAATRSGCRRSRRTRRRRPAATRAAPRRRATLERGEGRPGGVAHHVVGDDVARVAQRRRRTRDEGCRDEPGERARRGATAPDVAVPVGDVLVGDAVDVRRTGGGAGAGAGGGRRGAFASSAARTRSPPAATTTASAASRCPARAHVAGRRPRPPSRRRAPGVARKASSRA